MGLSEYQKRRQEQILAGRPLKTKEKKPIAKISPKRAAKIAAEKEERGDGDTELQKWFKNRMKFMGDRCYWCGCKVENKIYQYAIMSICHILPKKKDCCPSVATHPQNWVTLCVDHHHMFDNMSWEEKEALGFWETIRDRLIMLWPDLDPSEHRFFPESVRRYIEKHDPFSD